MSTGSDDEAFSWGGDDDPTLDARTDAPRSARRTDPATTEERPGTGSTAPESDQRSARHGEREGPRADGLSNAELVGLGVVAATYLFIAVGWIIGGLRLHSVAGFLVSPDGVAGPSWSGANLALVWLAALSPAIWFFTVYLLTRGGHRWLRWTLLAVGVLLLLPWPFLMVGAVGR